MATVAPSIFRAYSDLNKRWPNRSKLSDGTLPSPEHLKQSPNSRHNDGSAFDVTHDPENGPDGDVIASLALEDPRTEEVIWNRQIWTKPREAEGWRPYNGKNPHTHHVHITVFQAARNDLRPWPWSTESAKQEKGNNEARSLAKDGATIAFGGAIALGGYGFIRWLFGTFLLALAGCAALEKAQSALEAGRDIAADSRPCQQALLTAEREACKLDSDPKACLAAVDEHEKRTKELYDRFNSLWCELMPKDKGCEP